MRPALILLLVLFASLAQAMPRADAEHLLRRTGFTPTAAELERLLPLDHSTAIARLIDEARLQKQAQTPPPGWIAEPIRDSWKPNARARAAAGVESRPEYRQLWNQRNAELQAWWMQEMLQTRRPLVERMTMFWHNHFVSTLGKVRWGQLIHRQNALLREHALGQFDVLLRAVSRDPAMLVYLNNQLNKREQPNEDFARELFELFTLGEGHFSERDVLEAARAFTGWRMRPPDGRFEFDRAAHDPGPKTVLGRTGPFDGDAVLDLVLAQPRTAEFIVEKLWREFVSPTPEPEAVTRLAADFRRDWAIAPLLRALLSEPAFLDPRHRGALVKSPVEMVVGTLRFLEMRDFDPQIAVLAADTMGQTLFNPPNVKGWPGHLAWITSESLLARRQFLLFIAGDSDTLAPPKSVTPAFARQQTREFRHARNEIQRHIGGFATEDTVAPLQTALLPLPAVVPAVDGAKPGERLMAWLLDPVSHLK